MFRAWIRSKQIEFVRDILRDFCLSQQVLENQFRRFDAEARISFEVLREVLGVEMNKGLLWRLKDTSHHLFRTDQEGDVSGQLLDWCLGYIFHETMKLKEDAYQRESYGSRFIRKIIVSSRRLFIRYLPNHRGNTLLARFLYDRNSLVRMVFVDDYPDLIQGMYGSHPEKMYQLAAQSLLLGGWEQEARQAEEQGRLMLTEHTDTAATVPDPFVFAEAADTLNQP